MKNLIKTDVVIKKEEIKRPENIQFDTQKEIEEESKELISYNYNRIFVAGIDYYVTKDELLRFISQFGKINKIEIPIDFNTGLNRGFAFIESQDNTNLITIKERLNGIKFRGRILKTDWAIINKVK
jgi:RNA recognition motif-containing protein